MTRMITLKDGTEIPAEDFWLRAPMSMITKFSEPAYIKPDPTQPRVDRLIASVERYMLAVKRLGEESGYNRLTYFEAPILKMPTEEMRAEAHDRWLELNNSGQELAALVAICKTHIPHERSPE